ncbi:MAG: hypothetical protein V1872_14135 [bacterium]
MLRDKANFDIREGLLTAILRMDKNNKFPDYNGFRGGRFFSIFHYCLWYYKNKNSPL